MIYSQNVLITSVKIDGCVEQSYHTPKRVTFTQNYLIDVSQCLLHRRFSYLNEQISLFDLHVCQQNSLPAFSFLFYSSVQSPQIQM